MFVYYLDWRHKLFAGYLAALAAIAVAYKNLDTLSDLKTLAGATFVLSLIFWMIDFRIRDLFRHCSKAAAALENTVIVKETIHLSAITTQPDGSEQTTERLLAGKRVELQGSFQHYEEGQKTQFHAFSHHMAFDTLIVTVASFAFYYVAYDKDNVGLSIALGIGIGTVPRLFVGLYKRCVPPLLKKLRE